MQLQKLVYIAHGWNLAINGEPLTLDGPEAWDYGPVYTALWDALRSYGRGHISREIRNADYIPGVFKDNPDQPACASLTDKEGSVVERVYLDYGRFHAYQLSALTHRNGTPWRRVFGEGEGKSREIPAAMIREHFVELARSHRT